MRSGWVEALALAAPVMTAVLVVRISTQSALALAREERSEAAKKDAYVMLADHVVRVRQPALVLNPDLTDDHPLMPPWPNDDERYRMFAHVEVFGSEPFATSSRTSSRRPLGPGRGWAN